jgi:serine/threonine-protein kinase
MQSGFWPRVREARLVRVLAVYLAASWLILQATSLFIGSLDLPRWFMPAAIILLLIGLLVISATAWVQSHPTTATRAEAEEIPSSWEIDLGDMRNSVARGRLPHLTWARAILGGVVAFSLLFGLAGGYVLVQNRGSALSLPRAMAGTAGPGLAVLPFAVNDPALDRWREGMVDLLSTNLDGVGGLRTIDSRTVLARWREGLREQASPDLASALSIARRTGARYALVGSAVSIGRDVRLAAELYELEQGSDVGRSQVQGPPDSVYALVDKLSIDVLRTLLRGEKGELSKINLAQVTTASLPALKAYLEGEVLFRRSDYNGSIAPYQRAVEIDSTFALALYRLSAAYGWSENIRSDLANEAIERAARFAGRLPDREQSLVRGELALQRGTLDGLEILRQAVRKYPDDPEAWYLLGDTYEHLGVQALVPLDEADRAFARAVELDPTFSPAYNHPIEHAFVIDSDSSRAADLIERYGRIAGGSLYDRRYQLSFRLAFGDSATRRGAQAALDTIPYAFSGWCCLSTPPFAALWEEVLLAMRRRFPEQTTDASAGLFVSSIQRGKLASALHYLPDWPEFLYFAFAEGLPISPEVLDRTLTLSRTDSFPYVETFYAGAYAADRARWQANAEAVDWLRGEARRLLAEGDTTKARFTEAIAPGLQGYALWKNGRADEALPLLEAAQQRATGYASRDMINYHLRVWIGKILVEQGRAREAERYLGPRWRVREPLAALRLAKFYEEMGDFSKARESYEYFASSWRDADPELQPMVQEARAAAQRLSSAIRE